MQPIADLISKALEKNEPTTLPVSSTWSRTYIEKVSKILLRLFAGSPTRPKDAEFKLMVVAWTETLCGVVPEHRLEEAFLYARRGRDSNYLMDPSEVCAAWREMRESARFARPADQYDPFASKEVCERCFGTGSIVSQGPYPTSRPCDCRRQN